MQFGKIFYWCCPFPIFIVGHVVRHFGVQFTEVIMNTFHQNHKIQLIFGAEDTEEQSCRVLCALEKLKQVFRELFSVKTVLEKRKVCKPF